MTQKPSQESLTDVQISLRRDEALRRALNTPPQPKHKKVKESKVENPSGAAKPEKRGRAALGSGA